MSNTNATTTYPTYISIQRNVPIPHASVGRRAGGSMFPFAEMRPGDSFFVEGYKACNTIGLPGQKTFSVSTGYRIHPRSSWAVRNVVEGGKSGVRVWMVSNNVKRR